MMVALCASLTPREIREYVWLHTGHLETSTEAATTAEAEETAATTAEAEETAATTAEATTTAADTAEKTERAVGAAKAAASRNHRDLLAFALTLAAAGGVGFILCALATSWCLARLERALREGIEGTSRRGDWQCRRERRERRTSHQITL